jgi:hypothetical protein
MFPLLIAGYMHHIAYMDFPSFLGSSYLMHAGLLGGSALLSFAMALERQVQGACFGTLALPSAAADAEFQSFFAAPRNWTVGTSVTTALMQWYVCKFGSSSSQVSESCSLCSKKGPDSGPCLQMINKVNFINLSTSK